MPVYSFVVMLAVLIVTGVVRQIFWTYRLTIRSRWPERCRSIRGMG